MTKISNTFGKREVTTIDDAGRNESESEWLYNLNVTYSRTAHLHTDEIEANTSGPFRLSWVCPACDREHRIHGSWVQVITAQQQILAMGMAVATAVMSVEVADKLEAAEVERVLREEGGCNAVDEKLTQIFRGEAKGSA